MLFDTTVIYHQQLPGISENQVTSLDQQDVSPSSLLVFWYFI